MNTIAAVPSTSSAGPSATPRMKPNGTAKAASKTLQTAAKRSKLSVSKVLPAKKAKLTASNPMDAIFNEMNELESQKRKSKKKKDSDDEESEQLPHVGTPIPGVFRAPNFVDLMRIESDNSMIFEFLSRRKPSVCELVLGYKMLRGRVDAFSGAYFDRTRVTEIEYHIPPDEELLRELAMPDVPYEYRRGPRTPSEPPPSPGPVSDNTATEASAIPTAVVEGGSLQFVNDADQSAAAREARITEIKQHMARRLKKTIAEVSALISAEHWHLVAAIKKEDMVTMIDKMVQNVKRADNQTHEDSDSFPKSRNSVDMEISDDASTSPPTASHLPPTSLPTGLPYASMPMAPIPQVYSSFQDLPKPVYRPDLTTVCAQLPTGVSNVSATSFPFPPPQSTNHYSTPLSMPYCPPLPGPSASTSFTSLPTPHVQPLSTNESSYSMLPPTLPTPSTSFTSLPKTVAPPSQTNSSFLFVQPSSANSTMPNLRVPNLSYRTSEQQQQQTHVSTFTPSVSKMPPNTPNRPLVPPRLFSIPPPPLPNRPQFRTPQPQQQNDNSFRNNTPRQSNSNRSQVRGEKRRSRPSSRGSSNRDRRPGSAGRSNNINRSNGPSNSGTPMQSFESDRRNGPPQWRPEFSQTPIERPPMPLNPGSSPSTRPPVTTPNTSSVMRTLLSVLQPISMPTPPARFPTPMQPRGFPTPGTFPRPSLPPRALPSLMGRMVPPPRFTSRPRRQRY